MTDLLIRGGTVIDGTGAPGRTADVRIRAGRIDEVAPNLKPEGEPTLDAAGAVVAPGFIDSHTHLDAAIFWDPLCDPMPQHGVTTVVTGNCSLTLAPIRATQREAHADVFSYVEDIPREVLDSSITWTWEDFPSYAKTLAEMPLGVNVATLVGHSQLRHFIMGDAAWERPATPEEAGRIAQELRRSLAAGALGLSSSLFDKSRQGAYVPSYYAYQDDIELEALFKVLGEEGRILQFIPGSGNIKQACANLERMGDFARRHKVRVLHNLITHVSRDPSRSERLLNCVTKIQEGGGPVYSMVAPRPFELSINFHQSLCFIGIPAWNEIIQATGGDKFARLADPAWRARARVDFDNCQHKGLFPTDQLNVLRIVTVGRDDLGSWVGRSLKDLADARGGHPSDVMADWVIENAANTTFVNPAGNTDPVAVAALLKSPVTFVSASDAGAHLQMFCGAGDTTLMLIRYVRERGDFSLEAAIHKLTAEQADLLGLPDRGRIAVGAPADLVVFGLDELRYDGEVEVADLPGGRKRFTRPPGGFRYTIVRGTVVQEAGKATGALPAQFIAA